MRCHFPSWKVSKVPFPVSQSVTSVMGGIPAGDEAEWDSDTTEVNEPDFFPASVPKISLCSPGSPTPKKFFSPRRARVLRKVVRFERSSRLRVDVTREYDLWDEEDFCCAGKILVALQLYLFSGKAECAMLKRLFKTYPVDSEDDWTDLSDDDSDGDDVTNYWGEKRFGSSLNRSKGKAKIWRE
ncbi:uncharacterized protein N7483_005665 [Penicillium malachiteum]|uniref:uncharacterized protein n=1 Tax=Penicillium malachiteum TaxID=1324776 RepID=UPI002547EB6C|nr:uncharacterized protein N7483_005665 [Penicillium malachiteum]KAJ5731157.1 hypothetical protein N7483_005665 [Penicillium malachiteum]